MQESPPKKCDVLQKVRLKSVKSKYVNTSKNSFVRRAERCVSQSDVVMLFAPLVRCFELIKVHSEDEVRAFNLSPLTNNLI